MDVNQALQTVFETNESLIEGAISIDDGSKDYDGTVYKLLRMTLATLSRLEALYKANGEFFNQGQTNSSYLLMADLLRSHIKKQTGE